MSRLPEKGEATRAVTVMNERILAGTAAAAGDTMIDVGSLEIGESGLVDGVALEALRRVYGDLFDIEEVLFAASRTLVQFMDDLDAGMPTDTIASLLLQGFGLGVLIERARWQS